MKGLRMCALNATTNPVWKDVKVLVKTAEVAMAAALIVRSVRTTAQVLRQVCRNSTA